MEMIGKIILYIIMLCAVVGAIASIVKEDGALGKKFLEGIHAIGPIFLPVAGIMALIPLLTQFVQGVFEPIFSFAGADPAMAATTFIAVDMGGYQLAYSLAKTKESWITAMVTGYLAGATIVFSVPVGLKMICKKDQKYLALGVMSGILTIPIGVLIACGCIMFMHPAIREVVSTDSAMTYQLSMELLQILKNIFPLLAICIMIALGLWKKPDKMIRGFIIFGKLMDAGLKLVVVSCIVEYFTGIFSLMFGSWLLDPIIADKEEVTRALEVSGYIGIMLSGAFPMIYLIQTYLSRMVQKMGNLVGFTENTTMGIFAAAANVLALFAVVHEMKAADKVRAIAFAVCGAFLFGDHLAFTANFQPNLIFPVMLGKFSAGVLAVFISNKISVPKAVAMELDELNMID